MTTLKVIATLTWKFDSDAPFETCLEYAKAQLDGILESDPHGHDFEGFDVQVDLAKMKDRKRLVHLGEFSLDDVFPHVTEDLTKREYAVGDKTHTVRMDSERYHVFKENHRCVACGLAGTKLLLDLNPGDTSPHFNMYAEESGRLVLMTKDHKIPKSKGGTDALSNFRTMCATCNNIRGNADLALADIHELRRLYVDNPDKLPRKELRDTINRSREEMASANATKEES